MMAITGQLLLSLLAIVALTGLAYLMGFRSKSELDAEQAAAEAEAALPGFRAVEVAVATDGRAALLKGMDGGTAIVLPRGTDWIVRRLPGAVGTHFQDNILTLSLPEPGLHDLKLPFDTAPGWIRP